jgi:transposase
LAFHKYTDRCEARAIIYSIVEAAKEIGLNPYYYLRYLFEVLPNMDIKDEIAIGKFLPWSPTLPIYYRVF